MFKIIPVQSKEEQKRIAALCAAEPRVELFAYVMLDVETGEVMGFSQFEISADLGYITDLKERVGYDDFEAMFILGRQTMNFIDTCGAHKCKMAKDAAAPRLASAIGFKPCEDGTLFADMRGMFDGHCSSHAVKLD